ncbi:MgtC/SapB family protein [Falsiroseomonas sp. E2-1-a20]|uniref:MgtC/SapB family protein n=1 Tax=Falsiroseomonas sp. E2-1-a20 TaxID=3239300 RepID=UPI003F3A1FD6
MASCGFVQATESLTAGQPEAAARIIEGVITGMGFVGGGAILKDGGQVHGTATAASLWAIGVAVAVTAHDVAVVIRLFGVLTLYLLSRFKPEPRG